MPDATQGKGDITLVDEIAENKKQDLAAAAIATAQAKRSMGEGEPGGLPASVQEEARNLSDMADRVQDDAGNIRRVCRGYITLKSHEVRFIAQLKARQPGLGWGSSGNVCEEGFKLIEQGDKESHVLRPINWPLIAQDRRVEVRVKDRQGRVTITDAPGGEACVTIMLDAEVEGCVVAITKAEPVIDRRPSAEEVVEGKAPEQPVGDPVPTA